MKCARMRMRLLNTRFNELHSHPLSHHRVASFASEADPVGFGCIWPGHGLLGGERRAMMMMMMKEDLDQVQLAGRQANQT